MSPAVSVCIPTYNQPELFKKCLSSVLAQEFRDYEIIVSDDSTNNGIEEYIKTIKHPAIVYVHHAAPLGSPANWNHALGLAKGRYIKILHHDDYFTGKDSLGKFVSCFEKDRFVDFVFSYSKIRFMADDSVYTHRQTEGQIKRLNGEKEFLFFRNVIGSPSAVCFKRDGSLSFDSRYKWLVDVDFYIRYLEKHPAFACIHEDLVTVVADEEGQISRNITKDRQVIISENLSLFSRIYRKELDRKKSLLFFQELFDSYDISSYSQLKKNFQIPANIDSFIQEVFLDQPKSRLLKKIKKRLLTSRYNKRIFKIERF
jgi:glycosyltransferase involved in cell wall biosynthesis